MINRNLNTFLIFLLLTALLSPLPCFSTEVKDQSLGITFKLPAGWIQKKTQDGWIIGHNTIPGMILVFPHMETSSRKLRAIMQKGLEEENFRLNISGKLKTIAKKTIAGDYTGYYQNQKIKARGIGIVSPNGGAYIIAIGLPEEFNAKLKNTSEKIAKGMLFAKADKSQIVNSLAGTWKDIRSSGHTVIKLSPNGTFSYYSDYSASGRNGEWGYSNNDEMRGRWTVKGTPKAGTIYYQSNDGSQDSLEYQVHIENGQIYWREYYFDGTLYQKQ